MDVDAAVTGVEAQFPGIGFGGVEADLGEGAEGARGLQFKDAGSAGGYAWRKRRDGLRVSENVERQGMMWGFAGGLEAKKRLLALEQA